MAEQTHINVLPSTKRKIAVLKNVGAGASFGYEIVESLVDQAWEKAKSDGLVTDAMIQSPTPSKSKKNLSQVVPLAN